MQIGDVRISEWSDNGSCRFWSTTNPMAPALYQKEYDGGGGYRGLRTTSGRPDFEYQSHVPASPGWEGKFAGIIHRRTSISHPRFGKGRGRNWNDQCEAPNSLQLRRAMAVNIDRKSEVEGKS